MIERIDIDDDVLRTIGAIADANGVEAYVVGGYVRDKILGIEVKDTDVVVVGSGIEFAKLVARQLGVGNVVVFEHFGTAMLPLADRKLEFVGARKESYSRDSRKPNIEVGTLRDDLSRRDFTVNAMAACLNRKHFGAVSDLFDGQGDLERKILRTPLDPRTTFDDDPLRILRAMRFAAKLGFDVEPSVLEAAGAMRDRLKIVSQERIAEEFLKLLSTSTPSIGFLLMQQTGVMSIVFPEVAQLVGVEQREEFHHKDVFRHTVLVVDNICRWTDNVWLRMAALLHDIAKPRTKSFKEGIGWTFHGHEEVGARMVKHIFRRMRFPMDHVPFVEKLVRLHLRPMALVDSEVTDSAVRRLMFEAGNEVDDLMTLCRADITSKNPKLVERVRQNYDLVVQKMVEVEEKDRIRNWQPPVKGDEIMQVCGLQSGRLVGMLKDAITDAIMDGRIPNDHDVALHYLLEIKDDLIAKTKEAATR